MCPAVTAGKSATVYQAINTISRVDHPDFGAAAHASYRLDPGVVADELDPAGRPVYAVRARGTATTAGALPFLLCARPMALLQLLLHGVAVLTINVSGNDTPDPNLNSTGQWKSLTTSVCGRSSQVLAVQVIVPH